MNVFIYVSTAVLHCRLQKWHLHIHCKLIDLNHHIYRIPLHPPHIWHSPSLRNQLWSSSSFNFYVWSTFRSWPVCFNLLKKKQRKNSLARTLPFTALALNLTQLRKSSFLPKLIVWYWWIKMKILHSLHSIVVGTTVD